MTKKHKTETICTLSPYSLELIYRALQWSNDPNAKKLAELVDKADGGKLTRRIAK